MPFHDDLGPLQDLYQHAELDSMGLFLGAGVNLLPPEAPQDVKRFNVYSWEGLLHALYDRTWTDRRTTFDELCNRYQGDWLGLATELIGSLSTEARFEHLDELIYDEIPRGDKDARLSKQFLDQAPTLRAALSFSACITRRTRTSWNFGRNPKFGLVLTSNYDFFFGAGWTRYQGFRRQWKVQTPFSRSLPTSEQRPISYIHGYLSYRREQKRRIVLTTEDYRIAYAQDGFAYQALVHAVRDLDLIFMGVSFDDPMLRRALTEYRGARRHFAFVLPKDTEAVQDLGITPVVIAGYSEVAGILREVYLTGLGADQLSRAELATGADYWERLQSGPVK